MNTSGVNAVIFAKDAGRMARFYRDVFAATVQDESADHMTLDCNGFGLIVFKIPADLAREVVIDSPPRRREQGAIRLDHRIADMAKARAIAKGLGGQIDEAPPEWAAGADFFLGFDPEGNVFGVTMQAASRTKLHHPTPELPVRDVERAQKYYRDALGFQINWLMPDKAMGAASREGVAIFFRQRSDAFEPVAHWMYAPEIAATCNELRASGARITEPLEKKPWGLMQFTVEDLDGNRFYFHCD
jgi:predicted enzyme related to lactoylglutathione lyase